MKKLALLLSTLALVALPLAACGSNDSSSTSTSADTGSSTAAGGTGGSETVDISAAPDNSFAFEQSSLDAGAGQVTFAFDNPAQISHDFCIEDKSGNEVGCSDLVAEGTSDLSVNLEPGTYTYFCDVAGHRDGGMEGTLTVK